MMEENKSIYMLELNEETRIESHRSGTFTTVRRVAGGWIYTNINQNTPSSCFVPYDAELATKEEIKWQREMKRKLRSINVNVTVG